MRWRNTYGEDQTGPDAIITNTYLDKLYPYFNICEDKKVLEIGPYMGIHTQVAHSYNPKKLTLVELNESALGVLKYYFSMYETIEIVEDDIFHYMESSHEFDVVLCLGVLYHLHSPLYLLELIANRVSPKFVCIESYDCALQIQQEDDNTPGARQVLPGWKSSNISIKIPKETIITAMQNLGYRLNMCDETLVKFSNHPFFCVFEKI
jgi:16S rRNA A1518/A1519 N6-dimethyltransferase RsmA/KsgA/DIM1 with predicted DNA glycosylase/AP lyase activity